MRVIAVLNSKGGVGKSTISTNLAHAILLRGLRVLLVDSDSQGSTLDWAAARSDRSDDSIPVIGLDRPTIDRTLPAIPGASEIDIAIVDGGARESPTTASAIRAADLVLIPVQPSPYDIWGTEGLVELVRQRAEMTGGRPMMAAVLTRVVRGTRMANEAVAVLHDLGLHLLDTRIMQRIIYPSAAAVGRSVIEEEPGGAAAREITELAEEVMGLLGASEEGWMFQAEAP